MNAKPLKAGDIYLIRFHPSVGSELKKFRPGCIISTKPSEIDPRFVLIAPLTANTTNPKKFELLIKNNALDKPSLLLTWYLQTIDSQRLSIKLGTLTKTQLSQLRKQIKALI